MMLSIDQNSHSLWDALPKLQALARAGHAVTHFVEDVDVAFTQLGASEQPGPPLLARESFHHSGGADWGAAMFYSDFLGRQAVDVRDWEELVGQPTKVWARSLGQTPADLYRTYSPGGTWQLIGPSYLGDQHHHRVIGDLSVAETAGPLRQMIDLAQRDMRERFPSAASRVRVDEWFANERALVESLLARHADGPLVRVYQDWLAARLDGRTRLDLTSSLFSITDGARPALLEAFVADYDGLADLYNQALAEPGMRLRALDTGAGELPFFAVGQFDGHWARAAVYREQASVRVGDKQFALDAAGRLPLEALRKAGICCLAGKAPLLVIQVRAGRDGNALALPFRGSIYMPAAHRLAKLLAQRGVLDEPLRPVMRVQLELLDRLTELDTPILLPKHLAGAMGKEIVHARELGRQWRDLIAAAAARLEQFKSADGRRAWQRQALPDVADGSDQLEHRRRRLAEANPKSSELHELWPLQKALSARLLAATIAQIDQDWQVRQLDYWDSRGAIWPWCVALGGQEFYDSVLARAEIYPEDPDHML